MSVMSETEKVEAASLPETSPEEPVHGAPIESRFLFVDVAALRAKQLRRGARPRLSALTEENETKSYKAERVAMDEVRNSLVEWQLPEFKVVVDNR